MTFDDPDQEPPRLFYPNHVRAQLPWPGTWITAYGEKGQCGVFLSGRQQAMAEVWPHLAPDLDAIVSELPEGTRAGNVRSSGDPSIKSTRKHADFIDEDAERNWLKATLNAYVNALRPRLRRMIEES
jgi:hypothetical protein